MWTIDDYTNEKNSGYLRINCDGKRVADVFPYAPGTDEKWIRARAKEIVEAMNGKAPH